MNFLKRLFAKKEHPLKNVKWVYVETCVRGTRYCEVMVKGDHYFTEVCGEGETLHADGRVGNWNTWRWYV